jgi:hypothetical protein
MAAKKKILSEYLHLFVLVSFALAQPLYDLLGQNPEFFVAHRAGPLVIIGLVLLLSTGVPIVLCLMEIAVRPFGEGIRRGLHFIFIGLLVFLTLLPLFKRLIPLGDFLILAPALLLALVLAFMYQTLQPIRMFMTVLIPVVLIFPLWLLAMTPVVRLVLPTTIEAMQDIEVKNPASVILVVFDELSVTALVDERGRIDPIRYPNFAALAEQSYWFPNAVGPHFQTMHAIPAMLTGRQPQTEAALNPTAADHPENLFTLLGDQYRVAAFESQTALCPKSVCLDRSDHLDSISIKTFLTDIGMIYLHIISPEGRARQLPKLDGKWTGFVQAVSHEQEDQGVGSRPEQFKRFVSTVENSAGNELYFLHVLLPHISYKYLSTGHTYNRSINHGLPEGIMDEASGWSYKQDLINVAYHQYLQQTGFTDLLLGKLLQKLKDKNIYDDSLIVITADHGVSFQAGQSRRVVTSGTAKEILKVPMLIKLPGQNQGETRLDLVGGIDILPTIADILQVDVPWHIDGRSMFSGRAPIDEIEIPGAGRIKVEKLIGFPRLDWQVKNFGSGSPLDRLGTKGPYPELVGMKTFDFRIDKEKELRFNSTSIQYFKDVDPESGFLPALFSGEIVGTDEETLPIAIALNNTIWATTTTNQWLRTKNYFAALFPAGAFKQGNNKVEIFLIRDSDGRPKLSMVPIIYKEEFGLAIINQDLDGSEILVLGDGAEIPIETGWGEVRGLVDGLEIRDDVLHIRGWAGDNHYQSAESIMIFAQDQFLLRITPQQARRDVAVHFNQKSMLYSGFQASLPINFITGEIFEIRVLALTSDRKALELKLPPGFQ